jgi:hypothetical protein
MLSKNQNEVELLKQVLIFNDLSDEELAEVVERLLPRSVGAGETIFSQGDDRDYVYIIGSGEVRVSRLEKTNRETFLAKFESGDIFGEDSMIFNRKRSATVTAITDTDLFCLTEAEFNWIRGAFPKIELYLTALTQTHENVQRLKIKWLNDEETISLATRRHPISMIIELMITTFLVFFTVTISTAFITFLRNIQLIAFFSAGLAGLVTLIGFIAGIWTFFEWRNDFFFITNLRVVWRERTLFRSSSLQEVPLRTIQSLNVKTSNVFARMIHVGDLIIKTWNSKMDLTNVNHPEQMKDIIDAFLHKARRRSIRSEQAAIRRTIRHYLGHQEEMSPQGPEIVTVAVQREKQRFTLFKTRLVEEETITYRKHWWLFFKRAWKSSLVLVISVLAIIGLSAFIFQVLGVIGLIVTYFIPFGIFLFWLYQYEDWRNDIYRITKDRIIDRYKKPFGKESVRSAPINNIQSVGHEIPNTIGLILNVGNVTINVGDETLTFDGVHDPALVHQDISRRMEELAVETERNRIKEEHERMATWLDIYHDETKGEFDTGPEEHIPYFD